MLTAIMSPCQLLAADHYRYQSSGPAIHRSPRIIGNKLNSLSNIVSRHGREVSRTATGKIIHTVVDRNQIEIRNNSQQICKIKIHSATEFGDKGRIMSPNKVTENLKAFVGTDLGGCDIFTTPALSFVTEPMRTCSAGIWLSSFPCLDPTTRTVEPCV